MLRPPVSDRKYLQVTQAIPPHRTHRSRNGYGCASLRYAVRKKGPSLPGDPDALRCRHLQFVDTVPVFPDQGAKKFWRGVRLQNSQRLTGHTFARKSCRTRIASLRGPGPMAITARTVAAKEQLVFVPLEKISGEGWIAGERVVAGVRRQISEEIRIIGEPLVRDAAPHDRRSRVVLVVGIVRTDIGPECVAMPHKRSE